MKLKSIACFITLFCLTVTGFAQHTSFKQDKILLQTINQNFKNADAQYKVLMKELPTDQFPKTYHPNTGKLETSWKQAVLAGGVVVFIRERCFIYISKLKIRLC